MATMMNYQKGCFSVGRRFHDGLRVRGKFVAAVHELGIRRGRVQGLNRLASLKTEVVQGDHDGQPDSDQTQDSDERDQDPSNGFLHGVIGSPKDGDVHGTVWKSMLGLAGDLERRGVDFGRRAIQQSLVFEQWGLKNWHQVAHQRRHGSPGSMEGGVAVCIYLLWWIYFYISFSSIISDTMKLNYFPGTVQKLWFLYRYILIKYLYFNKQWLFEGKFILGGLSYCLRNDVMVILGIAVDRWFFRSFLYT